MSLSDCCDIYCTSCRICYLKLLRPGDSVPFERPKYILPLGGVAFLLSVVVIVLDVLAIYGQAVGVTSPPPSFLGSPGISIWLTIPLIANGCANFAAYKKKSRFSTAIAFGFSAMATLVTIVLLAVLTMAISEEQRKESPTGIVIATILCVIAFVLFLVTSLSAFSTYMALTSHDERWFTDRGVQYESPLAPGSGSSVEMATLSVPSAQPAFLFYAPSNEAHRYSDAFQHVIEKLGSNKNSKEEENSRDRFYDELPDGRRTTDITDGEETYVITPASAGRQKVVNGTFANATPNV